MPGSPVQYTGGVAGQNAGTVGAAGAVGAAGTVGAAGQNMYAGVPQNMYTGNNAYAGFQQVNNPAPQGYGTDVVNAIQGLISAVQLSNVQTAGNMVPKRQTTEDIIASIISPEYEGLKGDTEDGGKVNG
jgi:hypothetical protein